MPELAIIALIFAVFLLAGAVKGLVGMGLPLISVALLTATVGLKPAISLVLLPSLVTNIWQAFTGGKTKELVRRIWPFLLPAFVTTWFGVMVLSRAETAYLATTLGVMLIGYGAHGLWAGAMRMSERQEAWIAPFAGIANGVLTGMTGAFSFPSVAFLKALGLSKDELVQAMGLVFLGSASGLAVSLALSGQLLPEYGLLSAFSVLPALAGIVIGQNVRSRIGEARFERLFFIALILLGCGVIIRAWV